MKQDGIALDGRPFSPTEKSILRVLTGKDWLTAQQIAEAVGLAKSSGFTAVLANMAEAGIIESSTRHGYRLIPNAGRQEPS